MESAWHAEDEAIKVIDSELVTKETKVKEEVMDDAKGVIIVETENGESMVMKNHNSRNNDIDRNMRKTIIKQEDGHNVTQQDSVLVEERGAYQTDNGGGTAVIVESPQGGSGDYDDAQKGNDLHLGYRCHICGRKFSVYEVYVEHERSHANEGERPFVCDVCNLSFKSTGSLIAHKRIHTGEKPFACSYCWKTFRQSATRNRHIKAMHADERRKSQKETMDRISQILSQQVTQRYQPPSQIQAERHPPEMITSVIEHRPPVVHPIASFAAQPVFPGMTPLRLDVPRTTVNMTMPSTYPSPLIHQLPSEHQPHPNNHTLHPSPDNHLQSRAMATASQSKENEYWQPPSSSKGTSSEGSTPVSHTEGNREFSFTPPTSSTTTISAEVSQIRRSPQKVAVEQKQMSAKLPPTESPPAPVAKPTSDPESAKVNKPVRGEFRKKDHHVPRHHACNSCGKNFIGRAALKIHQLVKHMGEKPFACEMCDQRFVSASALITHRRRHTGEKPYKCNICGRAFRHSSTMKRHRLLRHMPQSVQMAFQHAPTKSSCQPEQEASRVKEEIKMTLDNQDIQVYDCGLCSGFFSDHADLVRHRISTHQVTDKNAQGGQAILSSWSPTEEDQAADGKVPEDFLHLTPSQYNVFRRPFECEDCGKAFKVMGHLVMHKRIHSGEKPYTCNVCGKSFRQKGTMSRHSKLHKNWENIVRAGGNTCLTESERIVSGVSGEEPRQLEMSNNARNNMSSKDMMKSMQLQMENAEDEDEEEDEEDEMEEEGEEDDEDEEMEEEDQEQGMMSRTLKTSIMQPLRNRKAQLSQLSVTAPTSSHARWNCNVCGKMFGNHWRLERHKMTHSNSRPFPCEYCGKSFRFQSHLAAHLRIHTGEKPFKCNLCGKAFRQSATMHRHRKLHLMKFMPALGLQSNNMQHLLTYLEGQATTTSNPVSQGATTVTMVMSQPSMSTGISNHTRVVRKESEEAFPVAILSNDTGPIITSVSSLANTSSVETNVSAHLNNEGSVHETNQANPEAEADKGS
ncbi:uncharacterized protein LOC144433386 [Glandiceps talaboti]